MEEVKATMAKVMNYDNFRQAQALENHAIATLLRPNPRLDHAISNTAAKGLPPISVLPLVGQHLSLLTQLMGIKTVLEIGTLGGYSSICFAEAGAKVTSIEMDPKHRDVALENCQGLDVDVLLGKAEEVLPRLVKDVDEGKQKKFDMVFIDADIDTEDQLSHFDWAVQLTRPGGCIFLDDVVAAMFKDDRMDEASDSIVTRIGKDERVKATLVPTVASHPMLPTPAFNGYIFARVNDIE